jgi:hypothetical protein
MHDAALQLRGIKGGAAHILRQARQLGRAQAWTHSL